MAINVNNSPLPELKQSENGIGTFTKDFKIVTLNLLAAGVPKPIDLKYVMVEFSYYEDIFSPSASGTLLISESLGIIEKLQLHGNEYLRVKITKDTDSPDDSNRETTIDKLFRIYKISARAKLDNEATEGYILHFCSDELILSEQIRVNKSYSGKSISEIIKNILIDDDYLKITSYPKGKYDPKKIENTQGTYSFIVPNFKPFEAINWLCQFARSTDSSAIGADMIFFENARTYVFASMQTLFNQKEVYTFVHAPKNLSKDFFKNEKNRIFNVLSYEFVKSFDTLKGINVGTFANRVITIDPLTQRRITTDFNYKEDYWSQAGNLNKGRPIVNNLQNRQKKSLYESPEAVVKLSVTNSEQGKQPYISSNPGAITKDIFIENTSSFRKSQLTLNTYHKVKITIAGNPYVTIGQTVKFDMYSNAPSGGEDIRKDKDKIYSGKYLVTAVRHTVQTGAYNTVVELSKESIPDIGDENTYADVNNGDSLWDNTVKGLMS